MRDSSIFCEALVRVSGDSTRLDALVFGLSLDLKILNFKPGMRLFFAGLWCGYYFTILCL
jgi:hypothetical protein